jgi:hypothetical protein
MRGAHRRDHRELANGVHATIREENRIPRGLIGRKNGDGANGEFLSPGAMVERSQYGAGRAENRRWPG